MHMQNCLKYIGGKYINNGLKRILRRISMCKCTKFLLKLLAVIVLLFAGTFAIYFFNLDMKLVALIEPLLQKHYDAIPRNQSV